MAKERKVIYSLEVKEGSGATANVDHLIRKYKELKAAAQGANAAIAEAARAEGAARSAAARASVGVGGGSGGSGVGGGSRSSGPSPFARGMSAAAQAAREERIEREANLKAMLKEAGHRRHVAASVEALAKSTLRQVDGYRQLGIGALEAARGIAYMGLVGEESSQKILKGLIAVEAMVSLAGATKNIGGGLLKLGGANLAGYASRALPLLGRASPWIAAGASAIHSSMLIGQAFYEYGEPERQRREVGKLPKWTQDQLQERSIGYHATTMAGVHTRLSELDQFAELRAIRDNAHDRIGAGFGLEGDEIANQRKIARLQAEYGRGIQRQMFDVPGRLDGVDPSSTQIRATTWTQYAASQVEGTGIAERAAKALVAAEQERLGLVQRRAQIDIQHAERAAVLARDVLGTEQERLTLMKRAHMTTQELYGDATPENRERLQAAVAAAQKADRTGNKELVTKEHRDVLRDFNFSDVAQPYAIAEAKQAPGYAEIDAFIRERESFKQKIVNDLIAGVREAEKKVEQQKTDSSGLVDAAVRFLTAQTKKAEEAMKRAIDAKAQEEAIRKSIEIGNPGL